MKEEQKRPAERPPCQLTLRRVANGWIIAPSVLTINEFTHVASTPDELAGHVLQWAKMQGGSDK